jgi:hypothetical protein
MPASFRAQLDTLRVLHASVDAELRDVFRGLAFSLEERDFMSLLDPASIHISLSTFQFSTRKLLQRMQLAEFIIFKRKLQLLRSCQPRIEELSASVEKCLLHSPAYINKEPLYSTRAQVTSVTCLTTAAILMGQSELDRWRYQGGPLVDMVLQEESVFKGALQVEILIFLTVRSNACTPPPGVYTSRE